MDTKEIQKMTDNIIAKARLADSKTCGALALKPGLKDKYPVKGKLHLLLTGKDGKVKNEGEYFNTITVLHDANVAERMANTTPSTTPATIIDHTGIGTTSAGKSTTSIQLEAQVARVVNDTNTQGAGADDNDVVHVSTFGPGIGDGAIVEAGLFTDLSGTTLMAWQDFSVYNKGAGDTLTVTWTVTYGAS